MLGKVLGAARALDSAVPIFMRILVRILVRTLARLFVPTSVRVCVAAALTGTAACAHKPPPPCERAEPIRVFLKSGPNLNPGEGGEPLPTVVRVFVLKGAEGASAAAWEDLQRGFRETLGPDLLEVRELTLRPGRYEKVQLDRPPAATHLAVVASFRSPEGLAWRVVRPLPRENPNHCHHGRAGETGPRLDLYLDGNRVASRQ